MLIKPSSVAIVVRAHAADDKTLSLIKGLGQIGAADLYVCANETNAALDFGPDVKKLSVGLTQFHQMGVFANEQYTLRHLSDLVFCAIKMLIPHYAHYALIEYDVYIQDDLFIPKLCRLLVGELSAVDLIATFLHPQDTVWHWHASASRHFPIVFSAFFPFVVLSAAAIDHLQTVRMAELQKRTSKGLGHDPNGSADPDELVFCEAFVPSALVAEKRWRLLDFNIVLPKSYDPRTFNIGPPSLYEQGAIYDRSVAMIHPVCPAGDTLRKHLYFARVNGTMEQFISDLKNRRWNVPEDLVQAILGEAQV